MLNACFNLASKEEERLEEQQAIIEKQNKLIDELLKSYKEKLFFYPALA